MITAVKWIAIIALATLGMVLAAIFPKLGWLCGWVSCVAYFAIQHAFRPAAG